MGQCNVEIGARQSGVVPSVGDHTATQISRTPRGLELIKSCAKFYANGVAAKPTVLSCPMGPALSQTPTSSSRRYRSVSTVAAVSLFFLVLPSLALAAIVWWGATAPARGLEEAAGYASAPPPAQAASGELRQPRSLQETTGAQAVSTARSDIIIRKVKTQPIAAGTWGDAKPSISATE